MEADTTADLYSFFDWLHTNRKRVVAGAIVVVVLALLIIFWFWNKNQNELNADQALLAVPSVGVPPNLEGNAVPEPLLKISEEYSGTMAGADAQLLAAKAFFLNDKFPEAQQEFTKFVADHPGNSLIPQAQVGIAASLEAQGKNSDAVLEYKKIVALYPADPNIVYPVKLTLGRLSETENRPDQALLYYQDLARINDPYDPWVAEASERRRLLLAKHPELDTTATASPYQPNNLLNPSAADTQLLPAPGGAGTAPAPAAAQPTHPLSPTRPGDTNLPPQ